MSGYPTDNLTDASDISSPLFNPKSKADNCSLEGVVGGQKKFGKSPHFLLDFFFQTFPKAKCKDIA